MNSYIDVNKRRSFRVKKYVSDIVEDLKETYHIYNIDYNSDDIWGVANTIYTDYIIGRVNYESYIDYGLDGRMLMELRKSAVLIFDNTDFYTGHKDCNTAKDVIDYRTEYIRKNLNLPWYSDENWQYYFLCKHCLGPLIDNYIFDWESLFIDGDYTKQTHISEYERDIFRFYCPEELRRGTPWE